MSQDFNSDNPQSQAAGQPDAPGESSEQPLQQESAADSPAWSQMMNAAANLANQAAQQVQSPEPSPTIGNLFGDDPQPVSTQAADTTATAPTDSVTTLANPFSDNPQPVESPQVAESQAEAHEDVPPSPATDPTPAPEANPDVEYINGHAVGFAFLRYYKAHPEIGLPVDDQHGDVGGSQIFEHAVLSWDGANVGVENR